MSLPEVKLERIEPETFGAIENGVHQNAHMADREGLIARVSRDFGPAPSRL